MMTSGEGTNKLSSALYTEDTGRDLSKRENWKSLVRATNCVEIKGTLSKSQDGWTPLIRILQQTDVSHIQRLILPMDFQFRSDADLIELADLLKTGRFSSLEVLHLQTRFEEYIPFIDVQPRLNFRDEWGRGDSISAHHNSMPGTSNLGSALVEGNLYKLRSMSVSNCYVVPILEGIIQSSFELQSFSMSFIRESSFYATANTGSQKLVLRDSRPRWSGSTDQYDYLHYLKEVPKVLWKVFESGRFKRVEHLSLTYGALGPSGDHDSDDSGDLKVLLKAMESGKLGGLTSLRLSGNNLKQSQLADLVRVSSFRVLKVLQLDDCGISSVGAVAFLDEILKRGEVLALERLELQRNMLDDVGVDGIVKLAHANLLQHLQVLNLSQMVSLLYRTKRGPYPDEAFAGLVEVIEKNRFPKLQLLDWRGNFIGQTGVCAIVSAYFQNTAVVANILISKEKYDDDPSLLVKASEFMKKNLRLSELRKMLEEEEESNLPDEDEKTEKLNDQFKKKNKENIMKPLDDMVKDQFNKLNDLASKLSKVTTLTDMVQTKMNDVTRLNDNVQDKMSRLTDRVQSKVSRLNDRVQSKVSRLNDQVLKKNKVKDQDEEKIKQESKLQDFSMENQKKVNNLAEKKSKQESELNDFSKEEQKVEDLAEDTIKKNDVTDVPVLSAKVFLCGFPEVGKTTLRKSLSRLPGIMTTMKWETRPTRRKERRTRGIELCRIPQTNRSNSSSLVLWDLAGQEEFHVMHGSFLPDLGLAAGKATTFVLVLKAQLVRSRPAAEGQLLYWLRFVASSSLKNLKRHVLIVLNCFKGEQCAGSDLILWKSLIGRFKEQFQDLLHIRREPFVTDCRVASSVKDLKDYLFEHTRIQLEDVRVPRICIALQLRLKNWSERKENAEFPILGWEAFQSVSKSYGYCVSGIALDAAARFLHEIGEIIYFGQEVLKEPGSESMSLVVPSPQWFCNRIIGQLLLPKEMTEIGERSVRDVVAADGSMSTTQFQAFFEELVANGTRVQDIVSMLVRLGLCYRKGAQHIVVPALIDDDDLTKVIWEGRGSYWVMGRSLSPDDKARSSIPMSLFRRLQVELAQNWKFGGRGDSGYRAGKSFSSFKVGELLVLIQFDVDPSDPTDDRIDILVKSVIRDEDVDLVRFEQIACICSIMDKLESLCVECCPGLSYTKKVIGPWSASQKTVPMGDRLLISLTEIKSLVGKVGFGKSTAWEVRGEAVKTENLLSLLELEELKATAGLAYNVHKHDAASIGLLTDESLKEIDEAEAAISQYKPPTPFTVVPSLDSEENELVTKSFLREQFANMIEAMNVIHGDVNFTRHHLKRLKLELDSSLSDAKQKQNRLLRHVQELQSFTVEEKERSVPRYLYLTKFDYDGKRNAWISLKEACETNFRMHLLCEARFEDGMLHEVEGQEGIEIRNSKEWLIKVAPWLEWSLKVAILAAKITGGIMFQGIESLFPDIWAMDGFSLATAVDSAAAILNEQVGSQSGSKEDLGSADNPVNLKERMIAEAAVGELMQELKTRFVEKIGLRKVLLTQREIHGQLGSSSQALCSVRWICDICWRKYGNRAIDVSPKF